MTGIPSLLRRIPTWQGNLLVFGLLIVVVLAYVYRQVQQAHQTFLSHARLNAGIIAGVIERNARSAVLSQEVVGEIIRTFVGNTARFVDYLDRVEPFSGAELTAFAAEAGLAGSRITGRDRKVTEGPAGWLSPEQMACSLQEGAGKEDRKPVLRHLSADHLYCLVRARDRSPGCIVVGIDARQIEKLQEQISLDTLLAAMSGQAGIAHVRIREAPDGTRGEHPAVRFIEEPNREVAETRLQLGEKQLVVGLNAARFFVRIRSLWREFFIFSAVLAAFGLLLSWLLYRFQQIHLGQVRDFERKLADQREDAALGRAAASITHEIGNPLNAISMGLQRLEMEAGTLDAEHRELISTMRRAVERTGGIISGIRRYARPLTPAKEPVRLDAIVEQILVLYRQQCASQAVAVSLDTRFGGAVIGDAPLLEEVVENLVKNGIEAQPGGGTLAVTLDGTATEAVLTVENGGFGLSPEETRRILDPYFTTKTRGTGLGLSIAKRIVEAHGGRMAVETPGTGSLLVRVFLPAAGPGPAGEGNQRP